MQNSSRASPALGKTRDDSPSLSRNLDRLSISRAQSPQLKSPGDRRSASRIASSPITSTTSTFRSSTPGAYDSPRTIRRASSSLSRTGISPQPTRRMSNSSLRSSANQSSPVASPRRSSGVRVSSSIGSYSTPLNAPTMEEPPPLTAASIAHDYFVQELALHESEFAGAPVAVLLHDACYGHRFSRPKTSKANLSMIVERPERVLAAVIGLCTAYVRLGSRHAGGQHAPHPDQKPDSRIPFKVRRTSRSVSLSSPFVAAVHGTKWMEELQVMCDAAGEKLALGMKELARPATPSGGPPKDEFHEGDLYLCSESLNALQGAIGGVCDAVDTVFSNIPNSPRRAFVAIRPPGHHCSTDFPSGFCWINNVHIGIEYAAQTYGLTHAVILDIDLHHGDGSQDITWERNAKSAKMAKNASFTKKTSIGYYSMHDINSYPCEWGEKEKVQNASLCLDNAHGQSIWNVHLEAYKDLDHFWALYEDKYSILLEKARIFLKRHTATIRASPKQAPPKAAIFISAGFDASEWEGAGMQRHAVNVPTEFYARFAKDVVKLAQEEGTGVNGRVISVLEGGYSDRALTSGVMSHISGLCQDPNAAAPNGQAQQQAGDEIVNALQNMSITSNGFPFNGTSERNVCDYDPDWWHLRNLQALETHVTPPPPAPTRPQRTVLPTYATPTQSFTSKVVDPVKFQRSVSGTMRPISPMPVGPREPPEVNWIVAVHELSKLIIPSDRQTRSHAPEDLAPPRAKKDRLSGPAAISAEPINTAGGRQLRTRKPKNAETVSPPPETYAAMKPPPADVNRRQTISDLPMSSAAAEPAQVPKRVTRRTSNMFASIEQDSADVTPVPSLPTQLPAAETAKPLPSRPKKSRAPTSKPTSPEEPELEYESEARPFSKQENYRPGPRRFPSQPSDLPLAVDFTKPINHIEPIKPANIKRIHLKVGTREEHDRKQQEREEAEQQAIEVKAEARPKPRKIGVSKAKKAAMEAQASSPVEQTAGATSGGEVQQDALAQASHEQSSSMQRPGPPLTVPSQHPGHSTSPLLLDIGQNAQPPTPAQHPDPAPANNLPQTVLTQPTPPQQNFPAPPPVQATNTSPSQTMSAAAYGQPFPAQPQPPVTQPSSAQPPQTSFTQSQPPLQPSAAQPRRDLPVFSSTGAIPFAAPQLFRPELHTMASHGNGVSRSMLTGPPGSSDGPSPANEIKMEDADAMMEDVFDKVIPETPQNYVRRDW